VAGQAAETKVVNRGGVVDTSVANDCAPLFVAVSVYCRVSPGLALTAVAADPPWVRLLTSLVSEQRAGCSTVVTSLEASVAVSAGWHLVYRKAALQRHGAPRAGDRAGRHKHLDDQTHLLPGADGQRAADLRLAAVERAVAVAVLIQHLGPRWSGRSVGHRLSA